MVALRVLVRVCKSEAERKRLLRLHCDYWLLSSDVKLVLVLYSERNIRVSHVFVKHRHERLAFIFIFNIDYLYIWFTNAFYRRFCCLVFLLFFQRFFQTILSKFYWFIERFNNICSKSWQFLINSCLISFLFRPRLWMFINFLTLELLYSSVSWEGPCTLFCCLQILFINLLLFLDTRTFLHNFLGNGKSL